MVEKHFYFFIYIEKYAVLWYNDFKKGGVDVNYYCEQCKRLCESEKECNCGNKNLRVVTDQDYCFLLIADELRSKMLYDCFIDNGIDCILSPTGDGYRSALGLSLGKYIIYVLYSQYEQAENVVEFFDQDPTNDLRDDLINHRESWHINKRMHKKLCKKLKLKSPDDIFDKVEELVNKSDSISDNGVISSCVEGGHYILVKADEFKFWFNSATYEIFIC